MNWISLTKPRITLMAFLVALLGGSLGGWQQEKLSMLGAFVGIFLLVASSGVLNMYLERDLDGLMERTKYRPLPQKRLSPDGVFYFGFALFLVSLFFLYAFSGLGLLLLGCLSWFSYVYVYTPLKRMTPWALVVGAFPGAMPVVLGYVACAGQLDRLALVLFLVTFLWQLPHVLAIQIMRKEEYVKAGYPVLTQGHSPLWVYQMTFLTTLALAITSTFLFSLGAANQVYLMGSTLLGLYFIYFSGQGFFCHTYLEIKSWAYGVFKCSLVYQTLLFLLLGIDVSAKYLLG